MKDTKGELPAAFEAAAPDLFALAETIDDQALRDPIDALRRRPQDYARWISAGGDALGPRAARRLLDSLDASARKTPSGRNMLRRLADKAEYIPCPPAAVPSPRPHQPSSSRRSARPLRRRPPRSPLPAPAHWTPARNTPPPSPTTSRVISRPTAVASVSTPRHRRHTPRSYSLSSAAHLVLGGKNVQAVAVGRQPSQEGRVGTARRAAGQFHGIIANNLHPVLFRSFFKQTLEVCWSRHHRHFRQWKSRACKGVVAFRQPRRKSWRRLLVRNSIRSWPCREDDFAQHRLDERFILEPAFPQHR